MADTITPFGNHADDTSPFTEAPDDFPNHPADDAYWQSLADERSGVQDEINAMYQNGQAMLSPRDHRRYQSLETRLSELDEKLKAA